MKSIGTAIKNKIIESIAMVIDAEIDGRELGKSILDKIELQTSDNSARNISRGPITNIFFEIMEGLWENDKTALSVAVKKWEEKLTSQSKANSPVSKMSTNVIPGNTSKS